MQWLAEHWILLVFLGAYTALLVRHAVQAARQTKGVSDYYIGGRTMGGIALGLSFFATYSSTNSFVGFAGQSYSYGLPWLLMIPAIVGFSWLAWYAIAPRLRDFTAELGSLTIPDFIGFRFGSHAARVLAAVLVLFASFFYLTAIFKGVGTTLAAFLDISYPLAVWVTFFVVMTYTAVGGFISVVKTDAVQGTIMVVAGVLLSAKVIGAAGGVASIAEVRMLPEGAQLFRWDAAMPLPVLLGIILAGSFKFIVEPRQLSRFYALKDRAAVRHGMWASTIAFLIVYAAIIPLGLYARNLMPTGVTDTDEIIPALLTNAAIFGPVTSAFMLVALVAAAMSSIDSVLLVMASTFHRDIIALARGHGSEKAAIRATGGWVALFALITTFIALDPPGGIIAMTAFSGSIYAACFFPAVALGLFWRRGTGAAVVASLVTGILVLLAWKPLALMPDVHEVFPAMALSLLAYIAISKATPPFASPALDRLFGVEEAVERRAAGVAVARG